jgi:RNA-directed DNA polymerase
MSDKSFMNGGGESYSGVVPAKQPNKSEPSRAEVVEERPLTKENTQEPNPRRTPSRESGPSGLERVREAAKKDGKLKFTALLHHVTVDLLRESYYSLKKQAAPGVDGVTWQEYGRDLEARLSDLHGRIHRGAYRAQPSRRVWIPKTDGRQRPLGIAALEDKVVQHAVGTVLNQIWEEDFLGFSYGFRPGRSQRDALDALWVGIVRKRVNWILDLDVRSFFDKIQHDWLVKFVEHRIGDTSRPPDPEMAEGGSSGRRTVVPDGGRESARLGDFAAACQSLPALRLGCLGGGMAEEAGARRCHHRALCR